MKSLQSIFLIRFLAFVFCTSLLSFNSFAQKESKNLTNDTTNKTFYYKESKHQIQQLKIENQRLENEINIAIRIIEQQNSQLEQTNDFLSILLSFGGIILAVLALGVYLNINRLNKQTNKVNKKSKKILSNITGSIESVVRENYTNYENSRFEMALKYLDENNPYGYNTEPHYGLSLIKESCYLDFSESKQERLIEFLDKKINSSDPIKNWSQFNVISKSIIEIFSKFGKNEKLENFINLICNSKGLNNKDNKTNILNSFCFYLGKTFEANDSTLIRKVLKKTKDFHFELGEEYHVKYVGQFLKQLLSVDKIAHSELINNKDFIEYLNTLGLIQMFSDSWGHPLKKTSNYMQIGLDSDSILKTEIISKFG